MLSLPGRFRRQLPPDDVVRDQLSRCRGPDEDDAAANRAKAMRMMAVLPTIVATITWRRRGLPLIAPHTRALVMRRTSCTCASEVPRKTAAAGVRAVDDPLRRARIQRVDVRRPGGDLRTQLTSVTAR